MLKKFSNSQHRLARIIYSDAVKWKVPTTENTLYLTFDDGPVPEVTLPLLDVLDNYKVKATFFCVGDNVFHHPDVYKEILKRGHKTANHTFHHLNGWKTPVKTYVDDVKHCREFVNSTLFRPPYGKIRPAQIRDLKKDYTLVCWSVLSYDFDQNLQAEDCLTLCTDRIEKGNIYVFHDSLKAGNTMLAVVPSFIEIALAQGYSFDTLPNHF